MELTAIQELFDGLVSKNITASHLIAALLPTENDEKTLEELIKVEKMIQQRKKQIYQKQFGNNDESSPK